MWLLDGDMERRYYLDQKTEWQRHNCFVPAMATRLPRRRHGGGVAVGGEGAQTEANILSTMPKNGQQQERKDHRVRGGEGEKGTGGEGRKEPPRREGQNISGRGRGGATG
jgi:hypothetical protein